MSEDETARRRLDRVLWSAARNFSRDGCFNHCAAISYYALLSVVPMLSLLASVLGYALGSSQQGLSAAAERLRLVAPQLGPQLIEGAEGFLEYRGTIGVASLVVTLWVSSLVFFATETAVAQIFHRPPVRMNWRRFALSTLWAWVKPFLLFFAALTLMVLAFALENLYAILRQTELLAAGTVLGLFEGTVMSAAMSFLVTSAVYALALQALTPQILSFRALIPAALVGTLLWEIAKYGFAFYLGYASTAISFSGSAAAAVIFMLWIYYAAAGLLYSLEVAAVLSGDRG